LQSIIVFYFKIVLNSCDGKSEFSALLRQSSLSHDSF